MLFRSRRHEPPAMTLEGVLGPNTRLDDAASMAVDAPQALCVVDGAVLLFSAGNKVFALEKWEAKPKLWFEFGHPVTALSAGPEGLVCIGLAGGGFAVRDRTGADTETWALPADLGPVADCVFLSDNEIAFVDNGYAPGDDVLSLAPWDETRRGRIVAVGRNGEARLLAGGLHCPMGVALDASGNPLVSLFERASIVDLSARPRQSGYPAYLGRIRRTETGYLISCLARRDPLIDFLKTEKDFVAEMKAKIEPRHWISPRTNPEFSHEFPIELGATRLFGEIKPWAPSFSYGLVIETDHNLVPTGSAHSRANGTRHAISDAVAWNGDVIAVSRASGELLRLLPGSDVA